jgi:Predicted ATPase (AAA+ superfamily)
MLFKRKAYVALADWKKRCNGSYAALLEGARRVGKSTIAEEFAKENYRSYMKVDFANTSPAILSCFESLSNLDEFFLRLQAVTGVTLFPRESVLIFDEIQLQPKVRQAIKYLVHDHRFDYIETGSLLSIKKNVKGIVIPSEEWKIPVYPMDYEEFLEAAGKNTFGILQKAFDLKKPFGEAVHRSLMRELRLYIAVGGMPQAVEAFLEKKNFQEIDRIKRTIIDLYEEDFYKIDPSGRVSLLYESIPAQLARKSKRFTIHFALKKKTQGRDEELFQELVNSRTVLPCYDCANPRAGLAQGKDISTYKVYLADTGLFVSLLLKTQTYADNALYAKLISDKLPTDLGMLFENFVAQSLASQGIDLRYRTWPKDGTTHSFEIDFLLPKPQGKLLPIEVKSSRVSPHESLDDFVNKYSSMTEGPVILSQKDYSREKIIEIIPFYFASFLAPKNQ